MSKPANSARSSTNSFYEPRHPNAYYSEFCSGLGVNDPPRTNDMAMLTGKSLAMAWTKRPRLLQLASENLSTLGSSLKLLPENSREFDLALQIVSSLMASAPESLLDDRGFEEIVINLRTRLIRSTGHHLALVCNFMGVAVPRTPQEARSLGAYVVKALKVPGHSVRMRRRVAMISASLGAIPYDSPEFQVVRALVARITNPKRVPKVVRDNDGYQQVATRLNQAMMRAIPQGS